MNLRKNVFFKILIVAGILIFAVMAYVIIRSTSTVVAVVPNQTISEGTTITSDMLKEITVPTDTPTGFITDKGSLVGQKLRISVEADQLLYINNVMTSCKEIIGSEDIPDNYVITSMKIPSERAVGGLITAGDTVDILGVPNSYYNTVDKATMESYLGDMAKYDSYGAEGLNVYWVLANVKILETDSTLAAEENSSISTVTEGDESNADGSYYIVALSYADYQKLRLSEQYLNLWLSICPSQNEEKDPLYKEMRQNMIKMMQDSQNQSEDYLSYGQDKETATADLYSNDGATAKGDKDKKSEDAQKEEETNSETNNEQTSESVKTTPEEGGVTTMNNV